MGTTARLRVAFIGAGGIAARQMRYLSAMDDVELVAQADISRVAMERRSAQYSVAGSYTDYSEMLRRVRPDAVTVCTPNGVHAAAAVAALQAGADVLVEKPMAMNAREAEQMIDVAAACGRKLVAGFQWRYDPRTTFIRRAVQAGHLGNIVFGRVQALRRRGIPNWGVFGRKELQGGGPLIDIGVHVLEMAHFAMGSPEPVAASGSTFTYLGDRPSDVVSRWQGWDHTTYTVEDLAVGQVRFGTGAVLHLEASFAAHLEHDEWNFQLFGQQGGARWNPPALFCDQVGHMVNMEPAYLPDGPAGDCFGLKMRNWVEHVLYDRPTMAPATHGLMVQKMLDGIYSSTAEGREVATN